MTVSTEAKRTLVKSPPELWSEVSDPESLARHLDGLHEIRITRVQPETAVEWEADGANGSVRLQPSGFGTKVTLSLSRELPEQPSSEPVAAEPVAQECESSSEPVAAPPVAAEPVTVECEPAREPVLETAPIADAESEMPSPVSELAITQTGVEPSTTPVDAEPELQTPREGFFARLFKRRRKPVASADESIGAPREPESVALVEPGPKPMPVVEREPAEPEREPAAASEPALLDTGEAVAETKQPVAPEPPLPVAGVSADLATLEAEMAEQDEAMLTAMLDRLGAAHHRPFSRS